MLGGAFRILMVLADKRLPGVFRHIPTAKESGVNVTWASFRGFYMGRDVSPKAYQFYVDAFKQAHQSTASRKIRDEKGLFEFSLSGDAFHAHVREQVTRLKLLVEDAGLRP